MGLSFPVQDYCRSPLTSICSPTLPAVSTEHSQTDTIKVWIHVCKDLCTTSQRFLLSQGDKMSNSQPVATAGAIYNSHCPLHHSHSLPVNYPVNSTLRSICECYYCHYYYLWRYVPNLARYGLVAILKYDSLPLPCNLAVLVLRYVTGIPTALEFWKRWGSQIHSVANPLSDYQSHFVFLGEDHEREGR